MPPTNGNKTLWTILSIVGGALLWLAGMIYGASANQANFQEKFVSRSQYERDQDRVYEQLREVNKRLSEIDAKLGVVVRRDGL